MRVLGIDPGVARTGYGVVEETGGSFAYVASGCIHTSKELNLEERLSCIFDRVTALIEEHRPGVLVLEKLFFSKNTRTALQVGEARGTVTLAAARKSLPLFEYTPLQVKQAVAGYGKADKHQVQNMVCRLLRLPHKPAVDDEADALAVAVCHLHHYRWEEAVRRSDGK